MHKIIIAISRLALLCGALSVLGLGCVLYIPTNYHLAGSRKQVDQKMQKSIIPGKTTKEQLILSLGEPDAVLDDGGRWVYKWYKVKGLMLFIITPSAGVSGEDRTEYTWVVTFDAAGIVLEHELQKRSI